jgi:hypothetical protein
LLENCHYDSTQISPPFSRTRSRPPVGRCCIELLQIRKHFPGLYGWELVQQYREEGEKYAVDTATSARWNRKTVSEVGRTRSEEIYITVRVAINEVTFAT